MSLLLPPTPPACVPSLAEIFAFLVLCHFVGLVLATLLAESLAGFRNVHHVCESAIGAERTVPLTWPPT
uniref:Uncharacterized protein n=1 Tax=Ursus maritimus TaxID=29073 RepID=A0A452V984_URSMA